MSIFDFLKKKAGKETGELPDAFDSLAAICKFIAVQQIEPAFYQSHLNAIEMANSFSRVLASNYPALDTAFRASLPLSISEGSRYIRQAVPVAGLSEDRLKWLDLQMTEILKVLLPVVRDPKLPAWLSESKWAVEGAFV